MAKRIIKTGLQNASLFFIHTTLKENYSSFSEVTSFDLIIITPFFPTSP